MRYLLVLLLAGCASQAAKEPESFNAAGKEPACARQCLAGYNQCVGSGTFSSNRLVAGDVLNACQANTRQCLETCPVR